MFMATNQLWQVCHIVPFCFFSQSGADQISRQSFLIARDFERESAQARRQSAPALDMVRVADATAEAAEQQLQAAREVAANADEQLKAASSALV